MPRATPPAADPPLFRFFNEVGIIEQLARNQFERVMPGGLSLAQFSVLNHFVRLGGDRSLVDLARAFQVSKAAMTKLIQKLELAGLVSVVPNPEDQRGKRVSITRAGVRARDAAVVSLGPLMAQLASAFPDDELLKMLPMLERMRQWLDTHRGG